MLRFYTHGNNLTNKVVRGMPDERKCVRCGILQDEEICEPCMELLILGIGNPRNEDAWNRFVKEFSDALIRQERSERQ